MEKREVEVWKQLDLGVRGEGDWLTKWEKREGDDAKEMSRQGGWSLPVTPPLEFSLLTPPGERFSGWESLDPVETAAGDPGASLGPHCPLQTTQKTTLDVFQGGVCRWGL